MKIKEINHWTMEDVREVCIRHQLYTDGNCDDYENMLETANMMVPDKNNLYRIAKDICKHSEDQTITNIMCLLKNEAVKTIYDVEE